MLTHKPVISVAMPVYGAAKYLHQTIESVLEQDFGDFELIMVNDASPDNSKEIILSFRDPRIRYFENPNNKGITFTRNRCIEEARGTYIAILDNDDIALPDRLRRQLDFMEKNPEYGMCGSFYATINETGKILDRVQLPTTDLQIRTFLQFNNCFCNSSVMIRTHLLKNMLYSREYSMIEDYYFAYQLSQQTRLHNIPAILTHYRLHGSNTSIRESEKMRMLRSNIDEWILKNVGIEFTSEELQVHSLFINGNFDQFQDPARRHQLELWLIRLYRHMEHSGNWDLDMVQDIFCRRWIYLFTRNRKLSVQLWRNALHQLFPKAYRQQFLEIAKEKWSKKRKLI